MIVMGPKKNKIKEGSKKKSKESKTAQRWTDVELDVYADVLADPENSFAATLDKFVLKSHPIMTFLSIYRKSFR